MASPCESQREHEPDLDYSSSSFDEDQEDSNEKGVAPYRNEPYTSEELVEEGEREVIARDIGNRLNNTEWCMCAQCQAMPTAEESQCCHEIARTYDKITGFNEALKCITDHPEFFPVCLDQYVLETSYYQYRQQYDQHMEDSNEEEVVSGISAVRSMVLGFLGQRRQSPAASMYCPQNTTIFPI